MATVWPMRCASSVISGVAICTGLACCKPINPAGKVKAIGVASAKRIDAAIVPTRA